MDAGISSIQVKGVRRVPKDKERESREAISRLMEQYGSRLLRLCALYLKDGHLAQDAVQETFLRAYRHWQDYRRDASEITWLSTIAMNICRDMKKSAWLRHWNRRIDPDRLPEIPVDFSFPDDTVLSAVMALPDRYRAAVLLRYYHGMKLKETAAALGISDSAVRKRLRNAGAILRERLKEWYFDEEE